MSRMPLIGVSTSELRFAAETHPKPQSDPARRELTIGLSYLHSIELAGAIPVVLAPVPEAATDQLLDRLSGLCLSGGPDLDPSWYGEPPHPMLGPTDPALDEFELRLARAARERGLPLLGICRGAQVINVARGGSLIQHVACDGIDHRQARPGGMVTHAVRVEPGTLAASALSCDGEIEVNSFHHQAVARLGDGLRATAWSPDGLVEAIEDGGGSFLLGVQWHAESITSRPEQESLFRAFVGAAAARDAGHVDEEVRA